MPSCICCMLRWCLCNTILGQVLASGFERIQLGWNAQYSARNVVCNQALLYVFCGECSVFCVLRHQRHFYRLYKLCLLVTNNCITHLFNILNISHK